MRNFLTIPAPLARQRSLISRAAAALLLIVAATEIRAADQGKSAKGFDYNIVPLPGLLAFADANKIPVSGIGIPDPVVAPRPGDRVTFAVALHDQSGLREWLIDLSEVELSATHRAAPPPGARTVYSSTGAKYLIGSVWAEENVRIVGPFYDKAPDQNGTADKSTRFLVHENYLLFGLDRTAAYLLKIGAAAREGLNCRHLAYVQYRRFSAEEIQAAQAEAKVVGISSQEDEAYAKTLPAMLEFFRIAEQTPGLKEIILQVLARPSLWSIIHGGGHLDVNFALNAMNVVQVAPRGQFIPTPIFSIPFEFQLNRQPALECNMVVTEPYAPLATCSGILQLIAVSPKTPGTYLILRLLSANRATAG